MTPSSLAAAARRLGGKSLGNVRGVWNLFMWVAGAADASMDCAVIGSDADLCMALLETMHEPQIVRHPHREGWYCSDLADKVVERFGHTPLEAVLACVEAMEGTK
jgi:hypothetical protein